MTFASRIHPSVQAELAAAKVAEARGHFTTAFHHLERAHVMGQSSTVHHVRVHWHMFRFAWRNGFRREAAAQSWRIVAASLFTAIGLVPEGNTGGSDVSGFRRLQVPADLRGAIDQARAESAQGVSVLPGISAAMAVATLAAFTLTGAGCAAPADLDLSLDKPTAAGVYRVALVPPAQAPAINQIHSWRVKLATPDGTPVQGAQFAVDGGMPQHGHGLPTQPRVTRHLGDGVYQLDGMKFSMTGWWEVKLAINSPRGADKVTFNTVVSPPQVRQ